ncbi:MAG: FAD-binding oxidoreductase [Pseudonocardia sp.]
MVAGYRAVPPGSSVRLRKPSSNLFRFGRTPAVELDTSGLTGVLEVDPVTRTAVVQGMTTYEDLVDATLPHGLMPLVVPQLKTITLGGAVTGLGIESSSFRHGLPHESVREMDVLTGGGDVVTATPDGEHADLYAGFPNSYGTLGYALRLVIDLQPVKPYVRLTHRRHDTAADVTAAIVEACAGPYDFVDGVVFSAGEHYLTLGEFVDEPLTPVSDYTGQQVFYRSLRRRAVDHLTVRDYIWRWDTDWFWCSRAFGVQQPVVRALWPRRWRRSDVYRRLVAWDRRQGVSDRLRRLGGLPPEEPVVQDVEIPVARLPEFLEAFHTDVGIAPVWLCPLKLREPRDGSGAVIGPARSWPLYPMTPGELYVNAGFWSAVPQEPGRPDAHNRRVEQLVAQLGGHKSLYSTVHYSEDEFWRRYNGTAYRALKERYDPRGVLPDLYRKVAEAKGG